MLMFAFLRRTTAMAAPPATMSASAVATRLRASKPVRGRSPPSFEPDAFDAESEPAPEPAPPPFDEAFAPSAVAFAPFASEAPWSEPSALPPFDEASEPP